MDAPRVYVRARALGCFNSHITLRASLSGTFLQALPDLVTPLKGALFISAQLSTDAGQRPRFRQRHYTISGLGTNMTVEAA